MNKTQSYFSIFLRNQLNLCTLCLSQNRHYVKNLGLLRRIREDFPKLLLDFNEHEDRICWECNARLQKLVRFHNRVLQAQRTFSQLSNIPGEGNVPKIYSMSTLSRSLVRGKVHIVPMQSFLPAAKQNIKDRLEAKTQQENNATPQMELQPRITSVSTLSQKPVGKLNIVPMSTLLPSETQPKYPAVKIEIEEIVPDEPETSADIKEESEEDEKLPLHSEPKSSSANTLDLDDVLASMYVQKTPKLFQHSPELHLQINSFIRPNNGPVSSNLQASETTPAAPKQMTVTSGPSKQDNLSTGNNDIKIAILSKKMVMELREKERQYLSYLKTGFNCDKCVFNIANEAVYKSHMARHEPSAGPEVCDICEMRYETKEAMVPHYKSHFRAFGCLRCRGSAFMCRLWSTMMTHMKIHDNPGWVGCSDCGSAFENKLLLQSHIEKTHRVYCSKCNMKFKSQYKLDQHILRLHTAVKCDKCNNMMKGLRGLEYHKRRSQMCDTIGEGVVITNEDGSSQPYCGKCNKFFKTRLCLFAHMKSTSQHADTRYECDLCGKVYSTKSSIAAHIQFKHNNKGYSCRTCGKKFATKRVRKVHENYVHLKKKLEAKYTCDVCGKAFTTNAMLKTHLLIHTGLRQHQCQLCPWNFTQKSTLVTHMRLKHKTGKTPVKKAESRAVKQRQKKK